MQFCDARRCFHNETETNCLSWNKEARPEAVRMSTPMKSANICRPFNENAKNSSLVAVRLSLTISQVMQKCSVIKIKNKAACSVRCALFIIILQHPNQSDATKFVRIAQASFAQSRTISRLRWYFSSIIYWAMPRLDKNGCFLILKRKRLLIWKRNIKTLKILSGRKIEMTFTNHQTSIKQWRELYFLKFQVEMPR